MTTEQSREIVQLLQTFWPIEWSQRMSRAMETKLGEELTIMFKDYDLEEVQTVIRNLARTVERPPTYKRMLEDLSTARGGTAQSLDFVWEPYIYFRGLDSKGREYVKVCNVRIYPDGMVRLPKGVPWNDRLLKRQGIIDKDGRGIFPGKKKDKDMQKEDEIPVGFQRTIEDIFPSDW